MFYQEDVTNSLYRIHGDIKIGTGYEAWPSQILTSARLGFTLNSHYSVYTKENNKFDVVCSYVNNKDGVAILKYTNGKLFRCPEGVLRVQSDYIVLVR